MVSIASVILCAYSFNTLFLGPAKRGRQSSIYSHYFYGLVLRVWGGGGVWGVMNHEFKPLYSFVEIIFSLLLILMRVLKTYAAISNAHLSCVCKRGKLSGSCLSTLNGFGSTQLSIFLCPVGVATFSSQNN